MKLRGMPTGQACGAIIVGLDLSRELPPDVVVEILAAWLEHHVVVFPDQEMTDDDLERFALYFGPFGHGPFFGSIPGHEHVAAIRRNADETTSIFADTWHTDWSFQANGQTRDEFIYRHVWEPQMLVMWDNRSVLHRATGGYEGYDRLLHRTTIGAPVWAEGVGLSSSLPDGGRGSPQRLESPARIGLRAAGARCMFPTGSPRRDRG